MTLLLIATPTGQPDGAVLRWSDWHADPLVLAGLLVGGIVWLWITRRFPPRGRQSWYGWGALLMLAVALLSPLDRGADLSFTLHMAQHLMLMMVVAPLLALGVPVALLGWLRRRRFIGPLVRTVWSPVVAFALYHAGLFAWHIPALYTAALRHEMIHLLQHATFILGGVAFWGVIVAPEPHLVRATLGHRLVMVLAASVLGWLLSFALALAERPLYPIYLEVPRLWGLSALDDLRLGGGVMWVIGNMMYGLTVLLLVIALMNREARQFGRQAPEGP